MSSVLPAPAADMSTPASAGLPRGTRVLHLIDSGGLYGAEVMLLTLMQEQMRMGAAVVLGSIGVPGEPAKPLERAASERGIEVVQFRMPPGYSLRGIRQILRYLRERRVALVHGHGYKANVLIGGLPRFIRRVPYLGTLHGWTAGGQMSAVRLYEAVERFALRRLDAVVAVSPAMLAIKAVADLPAGRLRVIANGIDVTPPAGEIEAAPRIVEYCTGRFTIGIVGRLSPEKGHATLLSAVHALRSAGRDMRVLIVGEGRLRGELEQLTDSLGLRDAVLFAGYCQNASAYLPLLRVCALPSRSEGLPMVLLEAMRAGVPVVASRVGGIPEAVVDGQSALLVSADDAQGLARALARLQDEPALAARLAAQARCRLERSFSSRVMAEQYLTAYSDLLGDGRGSGPSIWRDRADRPRTSGA